MPAKHLTTEARAYIGLVLLLGSGAAAVLFWGLLAESVDWFAVAVFSAMSALASLVPLTESRSTSTRVTHEIGTSFAYSLFILVHPGAACLALWATVLADWGVHRRRILNVAFNLGQFALAVWFAAFIRDGLFPGTGGLPALGPLPLAAAALSILAIAVANHALAQGVFSLTNREPFMRWSWFTRTGLLSEFLCLVSGLAMAVLWWVDRWLVVLGAIPIWTLVFLIWTLNRREQALETRRAELRSLQGLGLEIGSELDEVRLGEAILRVTREAVDASGALILSFDEREPRWIVEAQACPGRPAPATVRLDGLDIERRVDGIPWRADDSGQLASLDPGLLASGVSGLLFAPLETRDGSARLLALLHDRSRRPFGEQDEQRLATLLPFINVALSNARLVADLKRTQSQLLQSEKMSALGLLVSGVAHEINNPLTSVVGYAELLRTRETERAKLRLLGHVVDEANRAGKIVRDLLAFSRTHKPEMALIDVNGVLEHLLEFRAYQLAVHNIGVERRLAPLLPPVRADRHQLEQVFLNLIANSEHAIRALGRSGRITIESRVVGEWVRIRVTDDGGGIPEAARERIFLPFYTTKDVGSGTGLGLSICYGIVEAHGGRIEIESREGQGCAFFVDLPVASGVAQPEPPSATAALEARDEVQPGRLLVVDDEEPIALLVKEYLEPRGWEVSSAKEGAQALEQVARFDFDVLLVDLRMPGMDGQSFFERLKEMRPDLAERVVFATGDAGSESSARFLELTEAPVLRKPYRLLELASVLARLAEKDGPGPSV